MMMWLSRRSYQECNQSTAYIYRKQISRSILAWLSIDHNMALSTCYDMLPQYKATLLHLSFLPAVTSARHRLPIQLLDDRDSTKTRVITLLLAV